MKIITKADYNQLNTAIDNQKPLSKELKQVAKRVFSALENTSGFSKNENETSFVSHTELRSLASKIRTNVLLSLSIRSQPSFRVFGESKTQKTARQLFNLLPADQKTQLIQEVKEQIEYRCKIPDRWSKEPHPKLSLTEIKRVLEWLTPSNSKEVARLRNTIEQFEQRFAEKGLLSIKEMRSLEKVLEKDPNSLLAAALVQKCIATQQYLGLKSIIGDKEKEGDLFQHMTGISAQKLEQLDPLIQAIAKKQEEWSTPRKLLSKLYNCLFHAEAISSKKAFSLVMPMDLFTAAYDEVESTKPAKISSSQKSFLSSIKELFSKTKSVIDSEGCISKQKAFELRHDIHSLDQEIRGTFSGERSREIVDLDVFLKKSGDIPIVNQVHSSSKTDKTLHIEKTFYADLNTVRKQVLKGNIEQFTTLSSKAQNTLVDELLKNIKKNKSILKEIKKQLESSWNPSDTAFAEPLLIGKISIAIENPLKNFYRNKGPFSPAIAYSFFNLKAMDPQERVEKAPWATERAMQALQKKIDQAFIKSPGYITPDLPPDEEIKDFIEKIDQESITIKSFRFRSLQHKQNKLIKLKICLEKIQGTIPNRILKLKRIEKVETSSNITNLQDIQTALKTLIENILYFPVQKKPSGQKYINETQGLSEITEEDVL